MADREVAIQISSTIKIDEDNIHCGHYCPHRDSGGSGSMANPIDWRCILFKRKLAWNSKKRWEGPDWCFRCDECKEKYP